MKLITLALKNGNKITLPFERFHSMKQTDDATELRFKVANDAESLELFECYNYDFDKYNELLNALAQNDK